MEHLLSHFSRNNFLRIVLISGLLFSFLQGIHAQEKDDVDKTLSPYFVVISENPETDNLPLKETSVQADVVGAIADVKVKQVYVNSGKNRLEAIYTFPLSTKAAVYGMKMTIGSRTITAKIEEREKARQDYEKAKSEGKRASLLEQSRPNVFTMNVSNIAVGDTIIVELQYTELLVPEKGKYSFVYPTVVGPRYSNKNKKSAEVDDGFVATPYTRSGEAPAYDFNFELHLLSAIPIQSLLCNSHKMLIKNDGLNRSSVKLDPADTKRGNKDVIVDYSLQGDKIESGMLLYEGADENFFLMMVQPPKKVMKEEIPPREYVFIIDVSGSMRGFPLTISKQLMRNLIVNLNPDDQFNVILFSLNTGIFSPTSVKATPENVERASRYIDQHDGGGNTELLQALEDAYKLPRAGEDISRTFVIITDGYVDVEKEAFEMIRKNSAHTNVFSFGIGSGVNRYLIEGMAFMGNGEPMIITKENEAEKQAEKFRTYINTPVLTRIKADYASFQAYDVEPAAVPDMLAERPIVIFGKYKGKAAGKVTLSGKAGKKNYKQTFDLSRIKPDASNSAIRYLWARERIKLLDYYVSDHGYNEALKKNDIQAITELGLKYNLMTNYTSFIAIDEQVVEQDGKLVTVKQPIPLPEGVSDYAVGHDAGFVSGFKFNSLSIKSSEPSAKNIRKQLVKLEEVEEEVEEEIFLSNQLDLQPQFPGGRSALDSYMISHSAPFKKEVVKQVRVRFIVGADGKISGIEILDSVSSSVDRKIIGMFSKMPKWTPGKKGGKAVRTQLVLPLVIG